MTTWSITGAIAAQSAAHDRLQRAVDNQTAVEIWLGDCRITTAADMSAALMWVGKSKKYRLVQQRAASRESEIFAAARSALARAKGE